MPSTYPTTTAAKSDADGKHYRAQAEAAGIPVDAVPGMVEYECRTAIRDLFAVHGHEHGRELVAMYVNDLFAGRRQ